MQESNCALTPTRPGPNGLNLAAGGIMQITPMAGDTIFRQIPKYDLNNPDVKNYYSNIYNYASQNGIGLGYFDFPLQGIPAYKDLSTSQQSFIQQATKTIYDGQCEDNETGVLHCQTSEPQLNDMKGNINLGALALIGTGDYLKNNIGQSEWNELPEDTQLKLLAVGYKLGIGETGAALSNAKTANGGQPPSWDQIVAQLDQMDSACQAGAPDCSVNYANKVVCYAAHLNQSGNACASQ
jgi:hypothetical protein